MASRADRLTTLSRRLGEAVDRLTFSPGAPGSSGGAVTHVYNPLHYAREPWEAYLRIAGAQRRRVVFLGMNPGPWGMAQTGVPFGEVAAVRDWMGIHTAVGAPRNPHPKRPIQGFDCPRSEVSGRRLWGLMQERYGAAERFFADHFVANYCPLVFMSETGRNVTPDKLPAAEREPLFRLCDDYLVQTIETLEPRYVIGVGKFAENRIRKALEDSGRSDANTADSPGGPVIVGSILHPSPASPAANKGWAQAATRQLTELGVW
jgi:single-strand selective monofunctional uracil DNA glycosylase